MSSAADSLFSMSDGPDFTIETGFHSRGMLQVAGVDEVGRGPLAGPVVAAAVILDPQNLPAGLNDSKKLAPAKRETAFTAILETSHVAWTALAASEIDRTNIRIASLMAMQKSVQYLPVAADQAIIDGKDVPPGLPCPATAYVKGDGQSLSIAAASIIAKVIRDRMMVRAGAEFPGYGFENSKGYGVRVHLEGLKRLGPCPLHRKSFSPVKQMLENG